MEAEAEMVVVLLTLSSRILALHSFLCLSFWQKGQANSQYGITLKCTFYPQIVKGF